MSGYGQQLILVKRKSSAMPKAAKNFSSTCKCMIKRTPSQIIEQWLEFALCQPVRPPPPIAALSFNVVLQRLVIARVVLEYQDRLSQRAVHAAAYLDFAAHKIWVMANGLRTSPSDYDINLIAKVLLPAGYDMTNQEVYSSGQVLELFGEVIDGAYGLEVEEEEESKNNSDSIHAPLSVAKMAEMQKRSARSGKRMTLVKPLQFLGTDILGGKARVLIGQDQAARQRLQMLKGELEDRQRQRDEAHHVAERACSPASQKQKYSVARSAMNIENRNKILQLLGFDEDVSAKLSAAKAGKGSSVKVLKLTGELGSIDTKTKVWMLLGSPKSNKKKTTKKETLTSPKNGKERSPKSKSTSPNSSRTSIASIQSHFSLRLSNNGHTSPK